MLQLSLEPDVIHFTEMYSGLKHYFSGQDKCQNILFGSLSNRKFFIIFGSDAIQQIQCEEATGFEFENEVLLLIIRIIVQPNAVFFHSDLKTEMKNLRKGCWMSEE